MKQRVLSQIAVYDGSEKAMRAPTTQEAASLVLPSSGTSRATIVRLPNGGSAYQPDVSNASLAIARRGADGKVTSNHDGKPLADAIKEPSHDR